MFFEKCHYIWTPFSENNWTLDMFSDREEVYVFDSFYFMWFFSNNDWDINHKPRTKRSAFWQYRLFRMYNLHLSAEKACNPAWVYLSVFLCVILVFYLYNYVYLMLIHQLLVEKLHYFLHYIYQMSFLFGSWPVIRGFLWVPTSKQLRTPGKELLLWETQY